KFYARIDERGDQVRDEVADDDGAGRDQRDAHDDRDVDALDRLPGELADAGPAEHAFDHDDARHEEPDVDADHGDDRQHRVGQRMAEEDGAALEALGAGGADEVLP